MKKLIKNYSLELISGARVALTPQEAAQIVRAWDAGAKMVVVHSSAYATHQIKSVERIPRSREISQLEDEGIVPKIDYQDSPGSEARRKKIIEVMASFSLESFLKNPAPGRGTLGDGDAGNRGS